MKDSVEVAIEVMKGFRTDIETDVLENTDFRRVLYTSNHLQVVLMNLKAGEEIGEEIHNVNDQFFRFESGNGKVIINESEYNVKEGDAVVVPAGAKHNVINTDANRELKMYTIYAPPHHKDGIVRITKVEAEAYPEKFDGQTTE
jgi:mannose-6-phosphate isomerase-like protein (cupin superfamily)